MTVGVGKMMDAVWKGCRTWSNFELRFLELDVRASIIESEIDLQFGKMPILLRKNLNNN